MDETRQLHYYRLDVDDVLSQTRSRKTGLTNAEAAARLEKMGSNTLVVGRPDTFAVKYLRQFKDLMIILLLASSGVSFYLQDGRTAIVLLAIVVFNTTIGFLQEFKAERTMASLAKLVAPTATVIRNGQTVSVDSASLVFGDIVYIEEGYAVPADLRIIDEEELATNDFALTGESNPSRKFTHAIRGTVPLANRHNLAFMGTTVAVGHAHGIVVGTGSHTELGHIASLSRSITRDISPLQRETNHIAARVTQGTVILCAVLLPITILGGLPFKDALLFAIGFASSIIPQGMPAEINTALAQAATKLARAKALVKKLSAVETLGSTTVICTDKTGTLTTNQMTVERFEYDGQVYAVQGTGYEPKGSISSNGAILTNDDVARISPLLEVGVMASNARIARPDEPHATWYCVGDPTEGAIVSLGAKIGLDPKKLDHKYPEIKEFSFDSARKRMSSLRRDNIGKNLKLFVKGAPESVLERCNYIWKNGRIRPITRADRNHILADHHTLAQQAMRNLGIASRTMPALTNPKKITIEQAEQDLVWLGMVSMIDPLREQVPAAMVAARRAHIKVSIVTGDYAVTAAAIAARAKLTDDPANIVTVQGEELPALSDSQVMELARRGGVIFARVAPEDKLRIVRLVQQSGEVVAVTGDGINDAPALKQADIGVAMGLTGTDVAKQSAEIVLLDDSFSTLVDATGQGRVIFQNIRKGALSCFTSNSAELVVNLTSLAGSLLLHIPLAISVMQILAIDLIAELFPIAALGRDKADGDVMNRPPRSRHDHILSRQNIIDLAWCGLIIGGFAYANYLMFFARHGLNAPWADPNSTLVMQATSLTYLTIVLCQLANIVQRRTTDGFFSRYQLHNRQFWLAIGLSLACVANIIYNPWVAPYFHAAPLDWVDWTFALGAASLFVAIREFQRVRRATS